MKVVVTAREILDSGHWDDFCNLYGINEWAINEGLMEDTEKFEITAKQADKWGLFPRKPERDW